MKRKSRGGQEGHGPSQRQLRAAEVVRHALVDIVQREELRDPELKGAYVTVGDVRASPDLKHMTVFVSSLGPGDPQRIANGLTRIAPFLRGRLARNIALKFTPELPKRQTDAIAKLTLGSYDHVALELKGNPLQLQKDDILVAFTDGVSEPENEYEEMFGEDRLVDLVRQQLHLCDEELMQSVLDAVQKWTGTPEMQDDLTLLVVRKT